MNERIFLRFCVSSVTRRNVRSGSLRVVAEGNGGGVTLFSVVLSTLNATLFGTTIAL